MNLSRQTNRFTHLFVKDKIERMVIDGVVDADDYFASEHDNQIISHSLIFFPSSVVEQPSRYRQGYGKFL